MFGMKLLTSCCALVLALAGSSVAAQAAGNVATCYDPAHSYAYPLNGAAFDEPSLRASIEADFEQLSKHFTHVRTYNSQYYGIAVAPIAAKYGLKLYLGVAMVRESWYQIEKNMAADAVRDFSGTVEAVICGNENMKDYVFSDNDIMACVNDIKGQLGGNTNGVQFGTVQRISEFLDDGFKPQMDRLANELDVLGVNIYPFFDAGFNHGAPIASIDNLWNRCADRFPAHKLRLTETGWATQGGTPSFAPNNWPSIDTSKRVYDALVDWTPRGAENSPKFWFMAYDRRPDDHIFPEDYEQHFGFFTIDRQAKTENFPRLGGGGGQGPNPPVDEDENKHFKFDQDGCRFVFGVDYEFNDIGHVRSDSAIGCCQICREFNGCQAFAFSSYERGTCWLKSRKGRSIINTDTISGYFV